MKRLMILFALLIDSEDLQSDCKRVALLIQELLCHVDE